MNVLLLPLGLFQSSGIAGMVINIILPLCHVQYVLLFQHHSFHESFHLVFFLPFSSL